MITIRRGRDYRSKNIDRDKIYASRYVTDAGGSTYGTERREEATVYGSHS